MAAGIYSMTYRGASGDWGSGMLVLQKGLVVGADVVGGLYDGTYRDSPDEIVIEMTMTVPPGVALVQGVPAQPKSYTVPFNARFPKQAIEQSTPVLVDLPPGPVNVIVRRLRSLEN